MIRKCIFLLLPLLFFFVGCSNPDILEDKNVTYEERIKEAQKNMRQFHAIVFWQDRKQEAQDLAKRACALGLGEGCIFSVFGDSVTQQVDTDPEEVKKIFHEHQQRIEQEQIEMDKKAFLFASQNCQNQIGNECAIIGGIYERGDGVEVDIELAKKFYTQACALNSTQGCLDLNRLQEHYGGENEELFEKTFELLKKDCERDDPFLCYLSGEWSVIKALRLKARTMDSEDLQNAKWYYEKACKLGFNPETLGLEGSCEADNVWKIRVDLISNQKNKF